MSRERFLERQSDVRSSAARLAEAVTTRPASQLVRDATIQRFEFTFEATWKTLKLWLEHQGHACPSPRATLKCAFDQGLIPDAATADVWLRMLDDRNLTTHAYDESLAERIQEHIVGAYAKAIESMAGTIAGLRWE